MGILQRRADLTMLSQVCGSPRARLQSIAVILLLFFGFASLHTKPSSILFGARQETSTHRPGICPDSHNNVSNIPPLIHQNFFTHACNDSNCAARNESFGWQVSPFQYHFYSEAAARSLLPLLADKLPTKSRYTAEEYIATWDRLPESILRADLWRYIALFMFGGIYADLDVTLESPLPWQMLCDHGAWPGLMVENAGSERMPQTATEWNRFGVKQDQGKTRDAETALIVGIEDEHLPDPNHHSLVMRQMQFLTWTIISAPLHPVMLSIMEHIVTQAPTFISRLDAGAKIVDIIMDWTGPSVFSDIVIHWVESHREEKNAGSVLQTLHKLQKPTKMHDTLFLPRMAFGVVDSMHGSPETGVLVRHGYAGSWIKHEEPAEEPSTKLE